MLKYAIILLDDASVPYCSYQGRTLRSVISPAILREAIVWVMKENLEIQFIYPDEPLPNNIVDIVNTVSHIKVVHCINPSSDDADIIVINGVSDIPKVVWNEDKSYVIRLTSIELGEIVTYLSSIPYIPKRINFVLKDRNVVTKSDLAVYRAAVDELVELILRGIDEKHTFMQSNLVTDRLFLQKMNNCGAGFESITIAPNGNFYICPGFYYDNSDSSCGCVKEGIRIGNRQLYDLNHAPICSHCDAYQCHRCIWMNKKTTREVNTPSQGQCITAHVERNASRKFLQALQERRIYIDGMLNDIPEIDYLDPFENRYNWR